MTRTKLTEMNSTGDDSYNNIVGRVEYFGILNDKSHCSGNGFIAGTVGDELLLKCLCVLSTANLIPMVSEYYHSAEERGKVWEDSCGKNGLREGKIKTLQTSSTLFPGPRESLFHGYN